MSTVIERLMDGDQKIVQQCVAAKKYWEAFFKENPGLSTEQLAQKLDWALFSFKRLFGDDYPFAKEMMPVTCLGALYNDGFEDEALAMRVVAAFEQSSLPSEVKGAYLRDAKKYYGLN